MDSGKRPGLAEYIWQHTRAMRGHVLGNQDRCGEVGGELGDKLAQGINATEGSSDHKNAFFHVLYLRTG